MAQIGTMCSVLRLCSRFHRSYRTPEAKTILPCRSPGFPTLFSRWRYFRGREVTDAVWKKLVVRPARFELATFRFGGGRSIQLSYGRVAASAYYRSIALRSIALEGFRSTDTQNYRDSLAAALLLENSHCGLNQLLCPLDPGEDRLEIERGLGRIAV